MASNTHTHTHVTNNIHTHTSPSGCLYCLPYRFLGFHGWGYPSTTITRKVFTVCEIAAMHPPLCKDLMLILLGQPKYSYLFCFASLLSFCKLPAGNCHGSYGKFVAHFGNERNDGSTIPGWYVDALSLVTQQKSCMLLVLFCKAVLQHQLLMHKNGTWFGLQRLMSRQNRAVPSRIRAVVCLSSDQP